MKRDEEIRRRLEVIDESIRFFDGIFDRMNEEKTRLIMERGRLENELNQPVVEPDESHRLSQMGSASQTEE